HAPEHAHPASARRRGAHRSRGVSRRGGPVVRTRHPGACPPAGGANARPPGLLRLGRAEGSPHSCRRSRSHGTVESGGFACPPYPERLQGGLRGHRTTAGGALGRSPHRAHRLTGSGMRAIAVEGVSKTYRIPHERHTTLAERLLSLFRPVRVENLPALREVTLEVPTGSFIGIVGANGSGKSTLLKVIAGLIPPDSGHVHINGSIAPLLELGLGFQP